MDLFSMESELLLGSVAASASSGVTDEGSHTLVSSHVSSQSTPVSEGFLAGRLETNVRSFAGVNSHMVL